MGSAPDRPLWTCPRCGKKFVTRNIWHSCTVVALEEHMARVPEHVGDLYRRFEQMVRTCGPIEVVVNKTYVGFMVRVRFASVWLQQRALRVALIMPRVVESPRILAVETYGPHSHGHRLRIARSEELDDELAGWVAEAYQVGEQRFVRA